MIGERITVNFENEGKIVLVGEAEALDLVSPDHL
jgi:hypothetical protein